MNTTNQNQHYSLANLQQLASLPQPVVKETRTDADDTYDNEILSDLAMLTAKAELGYSGKQCGNTRNYASLSDMVNGKQTDCVETPYAEYSPVEKDNGFSNLENKFFDSTYENKISAAESRINANKSNILFDDEMKMAKSALYFLVEENGAELAKVNGGLRHVFARKNLKKKLEQYMNQSVRQYSVRPDAKRVNDLAGKVFDALIARSDALSKHYSDVNSNTDKTVKNYIDDCIVAYAPQKPLHQLDRNTKIVMPAKVDEARETARLAAVKAKDSGDDTYCRKTVKSVSTWKSTFAKLAAGAALVAAGIGLLPQANYTPAQHEEYLQPIEIVEEAPAQPAPQYQGRRMFDAPEIAKPQAAVQAPAPSPVRRAARHSGSAAAATPQAGNQNVSGHSAIDAQFPQFQLVDLSRPLVRGPMPYLW